MADIIVNGFRLPIAEGDWTDPTVDLATVVTNPNKVAVRAMTSHRSKTVGERLSDLESIRYQAFKELAGDNGAVPIDRARRIEKKLARIELAISKLRNLPEDSPLPRIAYRRDKKSGKLIQIPRGLCLCGCGNKTSIPTKTDYSKGWHKGEPVSFIRGHQPKRRIKYGRRRKSAFIRKGIKIKKDFS